MADTRTMPRSPLDLSTWITRGVFAAGLAALAFIVTAVVFVLGERLLYTHRALPGVSAAGIDLSGMNQEEIELALGGALTYPETGLVALRDGERMWTARPADLGVVVDIPEMARQALAVGRRSDTRERLREQLDAWFLGHSIGPLVILDQRIGAAYLRNLATQIDRPQIEATVGVNGIEVTASPGQVGRRLDTEATLALVESNLTRLFDADVSLVVEESPPIVLDASQAAAAARRMLSQPLVLTVEGAGPWTYDPPTLAGMLRFSSAGSPGDGQAQVVLDAEQLGAVLVPLSEELDRKPQNARFIFNDETHQLELLRPAVIGREIDVPGSIQAIEDGLNAGQHTVPLVFRVAEPVVGDDATAEELGIRELVTNVSTYFAGSSAGRVHNIRTAASEFHGLLVAPGETLSMAEVLGDVTLDKGYAEALIIFGDRTIKGVGGGVCQVSTTLFRAVFFGGYPIVERYPHAYRVGFYETGTGSPGPGLDATVFVPLVDFKFTNDTPNWLLMETYLYNNRQLQWKFYSTSDARAVTWSSQRSNEVEAPEPLYKENPDLPQGKIVQVDFQADGLDVVVFRTVTRGGLVIYDDAIETRYLPWRAIFEFGPGTELPEGAKTEGE